MVDLKSTTSIITLNANRQNTPIKRQRMLEWTCTQNAIKCCLQASHLKDKDMDRLKAEKDTPCRNSWSENPGCTFLSIQVKSRLSLVSSQGKEDAMPWHHTKRTARDTVSLK